MLLKRFFVVVVLLAVVSAFGETSSLLVLHTNDFHDHIRPGYDGVGGMPYVSGYIKSVREGRTDVMVLDSGDVMEKGDMVAFKTHSAIMYEAMGRIGYTAAVFGNHDTDSGAAYLHECEAKAGMPFLCINYIKKDGTLHFPASKIFEVNGVKVGVIGAMDPREGEFLNRKETMEALAKEAARLKEEAHLVFVICHFGSKDCLAFSAGVPEVDVFFGGHTHEVVREPYRSETGALVVQAGLYAKYVGRLELVVDLETKTIAEFESEVVEMGHDVVPCDEAMLTWVRECEQAECPEASRVIGHSGKALGSVDAARLAAAAIRERAGVDVGFCHAGQVIRSGIPAGGLDVNAFFLTGGQRGRVIVGTMLTGEEIEDYLQGLMAEGRGRTEWAGFQGGIRYAKLEGGWVVETNLDSDKTYRVVMPEREWQTRFVRVREKQSQGTLPAFVPCSFTFIEALTGYIEKLSEEGITVDAHAEKLEDLQMLRENAVAIVSAN